MYCRKIGLALVTLLLAACARQAAKSPTGRIAILRFENLGADPAYDWMGRAFSEVIGAELGSQSLSGARLQGVAQALGLRPAATPGISSQRTAAIAAGATRLGYGEYSVRDGRLEARLTIEDPATGKMVRTIAAQGAAADVIVAATSLARQISSSAASYATANPRAIEAYAIALESKDAAAAAERLDQAIAADPNFAAPYRLLAEIKARQKDQAGAIGLLETAAARVNSPVEKARLTADIAMLRGDPAAREQALAALASADPTDAAASRTLATLAMARHNYRKAAEAYRKTVEIEPEDADSWNQLGYAAAWAGDLAGGMDALRRYQALRPSDPNPLDSQGDINILHGRFKEAEALYLEAAKKDPKFQNGADFFKAAMARLMTGDIAGADALAKQYADARAEVKDPLVPYRAAEWAWATGRRKAACSQLESIARAAETNSQRDLASIAYGTLAVWKLMLGDRETAARMSERAATLAIQATALQAFVARFLAQPPAPAAEWAARADRMFANAPASVKDFPLAYALLVSRQWEAAVPLLQRLHAGGAASGDTNLEVLLAWALVECGRVQEAEPLLLRYPIPQNGTGAYFSLHFPRFYYLRAITAEREGRTEEARKQYRLFLQLSGSDPLMWGEEKLAQARAAS